MYSITFEGRNAVSLDELLRQHARGFVVPQSCALLSVLSVRTSAIILTLVFWLKTMLHSHTSFTWLRSMVTVEEHISLLVQQITTKMADVTTLQSDVAGSGAQIAELMVRLVTNDPRIKRIVAASDETANIISRVQHLEARSTEAATSSP